ncbi:flagellar biosynthesis protein FlhB [Paenibacillus sp. y28]|uniref:flagellar biosynthesis protein FlhB n=1 Tax=Paenibacillus sp. y28 TaxID=3129110 RepID=UPI003017B295
MQRFRHRLNLQLFSGEKTEPATPKKKQESRKKGQVAKSQEIPSALILLFSFMFLNLFSGFYKENVYRLFTVTFQDYILMPVTPENVRVIFMNMAYHAMIVLAPLMLVGMVFAVLGNYVQIGFLLTGEPLIMKFSKLNPIEGFKKIFGMRSLVEFLKSCLKMSIIGIFTFTSLWKEKEQLMKLGHVPLPDILSFTASLTVKLGLQFGFIMLILAFFDYLYQRYEYEKNLRMSKQDIKDEYKKTEGDPLIKGKIREKQRRMAIQRMMQEIPKADVIITNPTHFAIAIQYDASKMEAPTVIAKGMDYIALKIRSVAKEHGIITMENKPLARALYDQVEIGEAIPGDMFQAVAEVLAYVYKLKGKVK